MSLFRGIAYIILGDKAFSGYPAGFAFFGQGYVCWVFSFELVLFAILAVDLRRAAAPDELRPHASTPSATIRPPRCSPACASARVKFILFLLTGLMSGIAAVCLTSRLGSTRPSIALGWELEIVTMVVLGGVSILGGSGSDPRRRDRRLRHRAWSPSASAS